MVDGSSARSTSGARRPRSAFGAGRHCARPGLFVGRLLPRGNAWRPRRLDAEAMTPEPFEVLRRLTYYALATELGLVMSGGLTLAVKLE